MSTQEQVPSHAQPTVLIGAALPDPTHASTEDTTSAVLGPVDDTREPTSTFVDDLILLPRRCPDLLIDRADALSNDAAAVFNTARTHRYLLTRRWAPGPTAVIIGANPSVAGARVDDPTTRRCIGLARRQQCGAIALLNLFALSSTDPARLARHPNPVGTYNDEFLRHVTTSQPLVIAAWGIHGNLAGRADQVLDDLRAAGVVLRCWGTTRLGDPRHPLYVRNDTPLRAYPPAGAVGRSSGGDAR